MALLDIVLSDEAIQYESSMIDTHPHDRWS